MINNVCIYFIFIFSIICKHIWLDCEAVDDRDIVNWLEVDYCFDFGEEVVLESIVAVVVGNSGIALTGLVIDDGIDNDDCDCFGFVIFFVERMSPFSFYIIYIIINIKL